MPSKKLHDELYDNVHALRRYATILCRGSADAEELVQDTLVLALEKAHTWDVRRDLRKWLFAIMHNAFVSKMRRRDAQQRVLTMYGDMGTGQVAPDQLSRLELNETLNALHKLPPEQQEVIVLISLEGMSYQEAANILDVPLGTLMSRLARGREALREAVIRQPNGQLRSVK